MRPARGYNDEYRLRKRKQFLTKLGLIGLGFLILVGLLVYAFFFAGIFEIKSVKIEGANPKLATDLDGAANDWLNSRSFFVARRSNSWLFSTDELKASLFESFPTIGEVTITKAHRNELAITFKERASAGIWCLTQQKKCYYFDAEGIGYAETSPSTGFIITVINDQRPRDFKIGDKIVDDVFQHKIFEAKTLLKEAGVFVTAITIPEKMFDEFEMTVSKGYTLLLTTALDLPKQIAGLNQLLKTRVSSEDEARIQYIDLRIPDRIYYQ